MKIEVTKEWCMNMAKIEARAAELHEGCQMPMEQAQALAASEMSEGRKALLAAFGAAAAASEQNLRGQYPKAARVLAEEVFSLRAALRQKHAEYEDMKSLLLGNVRNVHLEGEQARKTAEYWKAEHLAGNARIGELHDELAATALRSADHLRKAIKAEAKCEVLEMKLEAARRELAKVNNEFGSENADWPEAWRRVAEVKERAGRLWRDNETLRAQLATFTPLRAKGVVDADDNLDCWDTNPYEICTRHVAALNEKDPAAMWRVVQLFARDEAVPGA